VKKSCLLLIIPLFFSFCLLTVCKQQTDPETAESGDDVPLSSLVGTFWEWDSGGWGTHTIDFTQDLTGETVTVKTSSGFYPEPFTYNPVTKKGTIVYYGKFTISNDAKHMNFPQWKDYPHGAYFTLRE
jgi:hypothetical protein